MNKHYEALVNEINSQVGALVREAHSEGKSFTRAALCTAMGLPVAFEAVISDLVKNEQLADGNDLVVSARGKAGGLRLASEERARLVEQAERDAEKAARSAEKVSSL